MEGAKGRETETEAEVPVSTTVLYPVIVIARSESHFYWPHTRGVCLAFRQRAINLWIAICCWKFSFVTTTKKRQQADKTREKINKQNETTRSEAKQLLLFSDWMTFQPMIIKCFFLIINLWLCSCGFFLSLSLSRCFLWTHSFRTDGNGSVLHVCYYFGRFKSN